MRPLHDPGQDSDAVPEQCRIERVVNVRLDHGRVRAHPATVLDLARARALHERLVHRLPGLRANRADVRLQGRLRWSRVGRRQPAEATQLQRVAQPKREFVVAEAQHLLHDPGANDLLGAHPLAPALRVGVADAEEIGLEPFERDAVDVEQATHFGELGGARMAPSACQRKLGVVDTSHRGFGSVFQGGLATSPRNDRNPEPISIIRERDSAVFSRPCAFPDEN